MKMRMMVMVGLRVSDIRKSAAALRLVILKLYRDNFRRFTLGDTVGKSMVVVRPRIKLPSY